MEANIFSTIWHIITAIINAVISVIAAVWDFLVRIFHMIF